MPYAFAYDTVGTDCAGKCQPGATTLAKWAKARWSLPLTGCYNCRQSRAGSSLSTHAEGRAVDLHVHVRASENPPTPTEKTKGDDIAAFHVAYAEHIGVQRVIWLDDTWDSKTQTWRPYSGPFHGNHVHVELCWAAALELTDAMLDALEDEMTPAQMAELKAHIDARVNQAVGDAVATLNAAASTTQQLVTDKADDTVKTLHTDIVATQKLVVDRTT